MSAFLSWPFTLTFMGTIDIRTTESLDTSNDSLFTSPLFAYDALGLVTCPWLLGRFSLSILLVLAAVVSHEGMYNASLYILRHGRNFSLDSLEQNVHELNN